MSPTSYKAIITSYGHCRIGKEHKPSSSMSTSKLKRTRSSLYENIWVLVTLGMIQSLLSHTPWVELNHTDDAHHSLDIELMPPDLHDSLPKQPRILLLRSIVSVTEGVPTLKRPSLTDGSDFNFFNTVKTGQHCSPGYRYGRTFEDTGRRGLSPRTSRLHLSASHHKRPLPL